jgi:hypothetical protein
MLQILFPAHKERGKFTTYLFKVKIELIIRVS